MYIPKQRNVKKNDNTNSNSHTRRNKNNTGMVLGLEQRSLSNILMP
jgi:hypothetical protein